MSLGNKFTGNKAGLDAGVMYISSSTMITI